MTRNLYKQALLGAIDVLEQALLPGLDTRQQSSPPDLEFGLGGQLCDLLAREDVGRTEGADEACDRAWRLRTSGRGIEALLQQSGVRRGVHDGPRSVA
ncbi:MAG TPA: hypothetical protein VHN14_04280 [Kofleriaceae bacterium]|nr:hypothetical protein [Kofleriaceae bacterium]